METNLPVITDWESDMQSLVHGNAGYLNEKNAQSRAGGHHFLRNNGHNPLHNGTILNIVQIIKAVMSSAMEAGLGTAYIIANKKVAERIIV